MSASLSVESAACLVVAAVFKTVEGQSVLGGFNSFPLRQFLLFYYLQAVYLGFNHCLEQYFRSTTWQRPPLK